MSNRRDILGTAADSGESQSDETSDLDRAREALAAEQAVKQRWFATVSRIKQLAADLWPRFLAASQQRGNVCYWLNDLYRGQSCLPADLTADVLRGLLLIRLDRADECRDVEMVCQRCGLQRPVAKYPPRGEWKLAPGCKPTDRPLRYDLPHLSADDDVCPACGSRAMQWAHLVDKGTWSAPA